MQYATLNTYQKYFPLFANSSPFYRSFWICETSNDNKWWNAKRYFTRLH